MLDAETTEQFFPVGDVERLVQADFVFLFDLMARMREQVGEVAIICDDEEPFAVLVESAHVVDARPVAG